MGPYFYAKSVAFSLNRPRVNLRLTPYTFRSIYHPAFNLDLEDASDVIERFENHVGAVGRGVQGLRELWGRVREAERGVS